MENRRLEQLFKDKLSEMIIEPSTAAQDVFARKIQISRQRILINRISIAASILLLALIGIYAFLPNKADKVDLSQDGTLILDQTEGIADNDDGQILDLSTEHKEALSDKNLPSDVETKGDTPGPQVTSSGITNMENSNSKKLAINSETLIEMEDEENEFHQEKEIETLIADHVKESVYVEYFIDDPGSKDQLELQQHKPIKITIEYIASGKNKEEPDAGRKSFYSKLDNVKSIDEVLGDLRTYKDRLFALDFKKENKVKDEDKLEK